eukprot:Platyproteum_vivax@DN8721_c0_g1_i1.p1
MADYTQPTQAADTQFDLDESDSFEEGGPIAKLVSLVPELPTIDLPSDFESLTIGRSSGATVTVRDIRISSRHVELFRDHLGWYLRDKSQNGTWLNTEKLSQTTRQIISGDEFSLVLNLSEARSSSAKGPNPETALVCAYVLRLLERKSNHDSDSSGLDQYDLRTDIGSGNFSTVRLAIHKTTGDRFAMKIMEKAKFDKFKNRRNTHLDIESEVKVLQSLQHPNVVQFYDFFDTPTHMYMVTELMEGGDLLQHILDHGVFSEETTQRIFKEVLEGLGYMHNQGVVHRDLKPENILLTNHSDSTTPKISDFGLARHLSDDSNCQTFCGTPHYFAPEVINTHWSKVSGYGKSVDLWSAGVILYIMLSGVPPFAEEGLAEQITAGEYSLEGPEWTCISPNAMELVKGLMEVNPLKRLTVQEALDHCWVTAVDTSTANGKRATETPSTACPSPLKQTPSRLSEADPLAEMETKDSVGEIEHKSSKRRKIGN